MKIAYLEIKKSGSKAGHQRHNPDEMTALYIKNTAKVCQIVGADLCFSHHDKARFMTGDYDVIIVGYTTRYDRYKDMGEIINANPNARIYWIVGEYEIGLSAAITSTNRPFHMIANFDKPLNDKRRIGFTLLNLNLLIARPANPLTPKKYDVVYYGRWREGRKGYFTEYLKSDVFLSSNSKNFKRYKHAGCDPRYINELDWKPGRETLNHFRYSLYVEDEFTHKVYNHLANRFYESLFCNVVQFFDRSVKNTIERAGIAFDDFYYVSSHAELMDKINLTNQGDNWTKAHGFQQQWTGQAIEQRHEMTKALQAIISTPASALTVS